MQKMSVSSMTMNLQMKALLHEDWFWHRGQKQLGNGLLEQNHLRGGMHRSGKEVDSNKTSLNECF